MVHFFTISKAKFRTPVVISMDQVYAADLRPFQQFHSLCFVILWFNVPVPVNSYGHFKTVS